MSFTPYGIFLFMEITTYLKYTCTFHFTQNALSLEVIKFEKDDSLTKKKSFLKNILRKTFLYRSL